MLMATVQNILKIAYDSITSAIRLIAYGIHILVPLLPLVLENFISDSEEEDKYEEEEEEVMTTLLTQSKVHTNLHKKSSMI